jgi:GT2 family glycosyltransferase
VSASLAISLVTFRADILRLRATLRSLARAVACAREAGTLGECGLWVIDNTPGEAHWAEVKQAVYESLAGVKVRFELRHGQGNVGYGRAHNLALLAERTDFRLVLNPDVELDANALHAALSYMATHPKVVLLSPAVRDESGAPQYLCKRYPAVLDLLLRGFAPEPLKRRFAGRLAHYEMRDAIAGDVLEGVPIASGAFMLVRADAVRASGGFDPAFFLYFEDFDWSLRLGKLGTTAYVPAVRVTHHGGGAARKGIAHIGMFVRSAARFFGKHGWKWR